jgi:hypothetical protein
VTVHGPPTIFAHSGILRSVTPPLLLLRVSKLLALMLLTRIIVPQSSNIATATAAEWSGGVSTRSNDDLFKAKTLMVTVRQPLSPALSIEALVGYRIDPAPGHWRPLTLQMDYRPNFYELSRESLSLGLLLGVQVFQGEVGDFQTALHAYAGLGAVSTTDDLEALLATGEDRAESTELQTHPAILWGLSSDLMLTEAWGLRLRWHHVEYVESIYGNLLAMTENTSVGFEALFIPSRHTRRPRRTTQETLEFDGFPNEDPPGDL